MQGIGYGEIPSRWRRTKSHQRVLGACSSASPDDAPISGLGFRGSCAGFGDEGLGFRVNVGFRADEHFL